VQHWGYRNLDCIEWDFVAVMQRLELQDSRSVVAAPDMVDIAGSVFVGAVAAELGMVDIAGSAFVGAVAAELDMVGIAGSAFVGTVAAELDMVGMVDIAGSAFVGAVVVVVVVVVVVDIAGVADVDRHRLVVPWLPSYTVGQLVVGFLNSRSCLG